MRIKGSKPPPSQPAAEQPAPTQTSTQSPAQTRELSEDERTKLRNYFDRTIPQFTARTVVASKKGKRPSGVSKKRKRESSPAPSVPRGALLQNELWEDRLAVHYQVRPKDKWEVLKKYKKFTIGRESIGMGECVLVKHDDYEGEDVDVREQWKAKVLEVRALDTEHVYVRVAWLNRPEDLPGGRQRYHGEYELIPTNQMDIIDAATINGRLDVVHWNDMDDASDVPADEQYFWRQTYDWAGTRTFSELRKMCIDDEPHNPDMMIVQCSNGNCRKWMHAWCIANEALKTNRPAEGEKIDKRKAQALKAAQEADTEATVTLSYPNEDPDTFVELFISGDTPASGDSKSGSNWRILVTRHTGDKVEQPVKCLFCGADIE